MKNSRRSFIKVAGITALGLGARPLTRALAASESHGHGKQMEFEKGPKALLAKHGNSIIAAATERGVDLAYESSVGGCMPIIKTVRESLVGNRIKAMIGILNGTCNYILSKITDEGVVFEAALAEAQVNGYAEADPTFDVEGIDAAEDLDFLLHAIRESDFRSGFLARLDIPSP